MSVTGVWPRYPSYSSISFLRACRSRGKYFGYIPAPVTINIGNLSCLNAVWGNDGMVTCQPQVCVRLGL